MTTSRYSAGTTSEVIERLGLRPIGSVQSRTMSNRKETRRIFSPVDLEIQGRSGQFSVIEIPNNLPNLVGQIPLEDLDLVVDCQGHKLIPNPEHKNGVMYDEILEDYSDLEREDILAAIEYAAHQTDHVVLQPA